MSKIVCVSGYFDPLHVGHIEYFKKSKELGDLLMVIVNNDRQSELKKGGSFMPAEERMQIIAELRCVDTVVKSLDTDMSVACTLGMIQPKPDYFCNGGDQTNEVIPEATVCTERNIIMCDGMGEKIQSSSWLIEGSRI